MTREKNEKAIEMIQMLPPRIVKSFFVVKAYTVSPMVTAAVMKAANATLEAV